MEKLFYRPCVNCGSPSLSPKLVYHFNEANQLEMDPNIPSEFNETFWSFRPYITWFSKEKANPTSLDITLGESLFKTHDEEIPQVFQVKPFFKVCRTCYSNFSST